MVPMARRLAFAISLFADHSTAIQDSGFSKTSLTYLFAPQPRNETTLKLYFFRLYCIPRRVEQVFRPAIKFDKTLRLLAAKVHRARIRQNLKRYRSLL